MLGSVKCRLLDELPYYPMRGAGERLRLEWKKSGLLPPPLESTGGEGPEVHMYCGKDHMDMGIWASWSLLRFLPGGTLFIHSDGSLEEEHLKAWRRIIPNTTLITREESDLKAAQVLGDQFPLLLEWKRRQCYSTKFIDFHLHGTRDRIISLDSDVLCYHRPTELIEALATTEPLMRWHSDVTTSYIAPAYLLGKYVGAEISDRVNSGLLLARRWSLDDLKFFQTILGKLQDASLPIFHHWGEQSLYAISAVRHQDAKALSNKYSVYFGKTRPDSTIRHYVGVVKVRPRFFVEGIPMLLNQIDKTADLA